MFMMIHTEIFEENIVELICLIFTHFNNIVMIIDYDNVIHVFI